MSHGGEIWPAGSRASRTARAVAVLLVVLLSVVCKKGELVRFGGTNSFYGITNRHALVAYSFLTEGTLSVRTGDFAEWWERSRTRTDSYVEPAEILPALLLSRPLHTHYIYPPGYALFLAAGFLLNGLRYSFVLGTQTLLAVVGVPLLLVAAGRTLGKFREGLAAAALYAVTTFPAVISRFVLPDGLMLFFGAALLTTSLWAARRDRLGAYLVLGAVLGLVANFRSDILAVSPFVAIGVWRARRTLDRHTLARIGTMALGPILLLTPYGLLQREATGQFRFSTPALGTNLWEALGETPNPHGAILSDDETDKLVKREGLERLTPAGEAFLVRKWRAAVADDPLWYAGSVLDRQRRMLIHFTDILSPRFLLTELRRKSDAVESRITVRRSRFKGETGRGLVSWAIAHPSSFVRTVLFRIYNRAEPLIWASGVLVLGLLLIGGSLVALFRSRWGLLIGAIPLGYILAFSFIHLELRYLVPTVAPILFLGFHGLGSLAALTKHRFVRATEEFPRFLQRLLRNHPIREGEPSQKRDADLIEVGNLAGARLSAFRGHRHARRTIARTGCRFGRRQSSSVDCGGASPSA